MTAGIPSACTAKKGSKTEAKQGMKDHVPTYPHDDDRPEWEKKRRPLLSTAEDVDGEGARPSSLLPYYHHRPDRFCLLQLK